MKNKFKKFKTKKEVEDIIKTNVERFYCSKCKKVKLASDFGISKKQEPFSLKTYFRINYYCKRCVNEMSRNCYYNVSKKRSYDNGNNFIKMLKENLK